jgi:phytoene dehydrogenase-like protein
MSIDYDSIVIGSGHNAMVCAAYLARAGQRVGVFEQAGIIGGASATKELIPGYSFDIGASAHSFIHLTSTFTDLPLDRHGLHYIDIDPLFFMPFPDNSYLTLWRSVDRTCEGIARVSPEDAEIYRRFCREWMPIALAMADVMMTTPTLPGFVSSVIRGMASRQGWKARRLPQLRLSMREFLNVNFRNEKVKAMLGSISAQVGLSPDQPGTAIFVVWTTIYHVCGIRIPRGGSGMLAHALAGYIIERGGGVHANTPVSRILIENGKAVGIQTAGGDQIRAGRVVSGAHIKTTAKLLERQIPPQMERRIQGLKTSNGGGVMLHVAAKTLPAYKATTEGFSHTAVQLVAPRLDDIAAMWKNFHGGSCSSSSLLSVLTHSASDPTRSVNISIWAQYYPYRFRDGKNWDSITKQEVIANILDTLSQYAPDIRDVILDMRLHTPLSFESEMGLIGGDIQHIHVAFGQMGMLRPGAGLSRYKTPIRHLFLTGASTHPGGGIMGMSGLNAAREILKGSET